MYVLSQILVAISDLFCILSMMSKNKKKVVFFLILSTIMFASHYMCLGGWTGAAIALVEIVFLMALYLLETYKKTQYNVLLSITTIILTIVLSIVTWGGWISILPMVAMVIYLLGLIFKNVIIVKSCTFIRLALNGLYMLMLKSYIGAGLTLVILAFTIYGIVVDYKSKEKMIKENV